MLKLPFSRLLSVLAMCLCLVACRQEVQAPGDPVAAIKGMAAAIRNNDLPRYSRLTVPPTLHTQIEARWAIERRQTASPTAAQRRDYARMMGRFTAVDAEVRLFRTVNARLGKLQGHVGSQWPMMKATASLFSSGLIQATDVLGPGEKAHAKSLVGAVLAWAKPDLLADRNRAKQAIAVAIEAARDLDLPTLDDARKLEMMPALTKASIVLKAFKQIGRLYGADVDAALDALQARVIVARGDKATLEVSYPMLGQTVSFEMDMLRRDGRWYSADAVHSAELALATPLSKSAGNQHD